MTVEPTQPRTGGVGAPAVRGGRDGAPEAPAVESTGLIKRTVASGARLWSRISAWPFVAHVIRALERFNDRLGSQFAAAITYFSLLSLVPILMVAFSVAGFVLVDRPDLVADLKETVTSLIPGSDLSGQIGALIDHAVSARFAVGIVGLVVALYSGIGWMGNIRQALRAIWAPRWDRSKQHQDSLVLTYARNLGLLAGLGLAVLVSLALSTFANAAQDLIVRWLGLEDDVWVRPLLTIATFLAAALASLLVFLWIYGRLPRQEYRAPFRPLFIGSAVAAVLFELLKSLLALLVRGVSGSASGAVFGSVIGLLFFINIVARVFLMVGAWIATDVHTPGGLVRVGDDSLAVGAADPPPRIAAPAAPSLPSPTSSAPPRSTPPATPENEAPVAAALGVGLIAGWLVGRRSRGRGR
jgi:membrane protein